MINIVPNEEKILVQRFKSGLLIWVVILLASAIIGGLTNLMLVDNLRLDMGHEFAWIVAGIGAVKGMAAWASASISLLAIYALRMCFKRRLPAIAGLSVVLLLLAFNLAYGTFLEPETASSTAQLARDWANDLKQLPVTIGIGLGFFILTELFVLVWHKKKI